ncbi:MAG: hypothetical protein MMC33_010394 [Icmadophila ericetorum]|nr:hypothetical protein [Icmadophila ericetorum]
MAAKRKRNDTDGGPPPHHPPPTHPTSDFSALLKTLSQPTIKQILIQAARDHPDVAQSIRSYHEHVVAAERAKVIDFDRNSKEAWKAINVTYAKLSGSHQYDRAFDAYTTVRECIDEIAKQCTANASFGTNKSVLETLRKIGKSICLSNNTVASEVRKSFRSETKLPGTMLKIVKSMSAAEKRAMLEGDGWGDKLKELVKLAKSYVIFEDLEADIVDLVDDEDETGDSGGNDEEEEELDERSMDDDYAAIAADFGF